MRIKNLSVLFTPPARGHIVTFSCGEPRVLQPVVTEIKLEKFFAKETEGVEKESILLDDFGG